MVPRGGFQNDLVLAFGTRESWPLDWIGFLDFLLSGGCPGGDIEDFLGLKCDGSRLWSGICIFQVSNMTASKN